MPQPTPGDVHVNMPLTNVLVAFQQDPEFFVADKVFPMIPSGKQGNLYYIFDREFWHRVVVEKRGLSSESAGGGFELDTDNFFCDVYGLHKDVDDRLRANQDDPLDMDMASTRWLAQQFLLKREKDWASAFFTTSTWTGGTGGADITPSIKWDVPATAIPIVDLRTEMTSVHRKTGYRPNTLVLAQDVWDALQDTDDFLGRISISRDAIVTGDLLAAVLGLERVLIGGAMEVTSKEGATAVQAFVMTDGALLCYVNNDVSLMEPSAGYTFTWEGLIGSADGHRVKRFRMEALSSDRIEGEAAYDQKLVAADLGVYFDGPLT